MLLPRFTPPAVRRFTRPSVPRHRRLSLEPLEHRTLLAGLPLSEVIYLSTAAPGTIKNPDGSYVKFDDSDILRLDIERSASGEVLWYRHRLLFDGSDVGLDDAGEGIDALAILPDGRIVISTVGKVSVPGVTAGGEDLLLFTPDEGGLGLRTSGTWSLLFDGSDVGLSTKSENIDALAVLPDGRLIISTTGNFSVPRAKGSGEDLLAFTPAPGGLGPNTVGTWSLWFDGSKNELAAKGEKVNAVDVDAAIVQLSTSGAFGVSGAVGNREDVFSHDMASGAYLPGLRLDGSAVSLAAHDVNAIHFCKAGDVCLEPSADLPVIDVAGVLAAAQVKLAAHDARHSLKTRYASQAKLNGPTWSTVAASNWESGFYPGALWYLYEATGDPQWLDRARAWTTGIEGQKNNSNTHDIGFMVFDSFGHGVRLTGDAHYRDVVLTAAQSLSRRFSHTVGATRSWNGGSFRVIIDNVMNIELLFWAAKNGGTPDGGGTSQDLYNMAVRHMQTTYAAHVRPDGSTWHVVDFNSSNGVVKSRSSAQGKSASSTWSRGQAWAIHGFTMAYRETGDPLFLEAARKTADYYIEAVTDDWVPQADFHSKYTDLAHKDSSAAAIAASGMIELFTLEPDAARRDKYWSAASHILESLMSPSYFSQGSNNAGLLLHGARKYPGENMSYMFGDYYFLEAVVRYAKVQRGLAGQPINQPMGPLLPPG
jgi:unsaturated chondroitin disaccharide hydrolase